MPMYANYKDAPTLAGSWPILPDSTVLSGPASTVINRTIRSQATILGVRRETPSGFNVSGLGFYLDVDAYTNISVSFSGTDPLTLDDIISQINSDVNPTTGFDVAFRDNGFLRLKSNTVGMNSYLAVHTNNLYGPTVLTTLGLFAEVESFGGELEEAPTVDPGRQVVYPGQMLMSEGEELDTRSYNRLMLQTALNSDLHQGLLNRKKMAKTKEGSVTNPSDGFVLNDEVYVGMATAPSVGDLENLIVILNDDGTEPIVDLEGTARYTGSMTFSTDVVTGNLLCQATSQFLSSDEKDPVYVISDDAGMSTLQSKPLKVVEFKSTSLVVVNNRDDSGAFVNPTGTVTGRIAEVTKASVKVEAFRDGPGGSRVEAVQPVVSSGSIDRIEKNNRLVTTDVGVDFVTQVMVGDIVTISGHTPGNPISNNGTYRVFRIIDEKTIELVGDDWGPAFLLNVGTSMGSFVVNANGNFYDSPYVDLNYALPNGTYRLVYMTASTLSDLTNNLSALATPPLRYQQEADDSVGEALTRIMGPSVGNYTDVIYGDYRLNLEDIDYRLDNEHDETGRHVNLKALIVNHSINSSSPVASDIAALIAADHSGSGTLTSLYGLRLGCSGSGAHGNITNSYGLYVVDDEFSGVCTNSYALYISSQNEAVNNFSIYTNDGLNHFGDWVGIGPSVTYKLWNGELFRFYDILEPGGWLGMISGQINDVSSSDIELLRLYVSAAHTGTYSGKIYGLHANFDQSSSVSSASDVRILSADARLSSAGLSNLYLAHLTANNTTFGGSCTNLYGVYVDTTGTNVAASSKYGIRIGSMTGGTSHYGLFMDNISGGTDNYSIFTYAGKVHFGDIGEVQASVVDGSSVTSWLVQMTAGAANSYRYGIFGGVNAVHTTGTMGEVYGVYGRVSAIGSGGTITDARAGAFEYQSATGAVTTNAAVLYAKRLITGGTVGSLYGLYVDQMAGATNNYAIYTNSGLVRFGDTVSVLNDIQFAGLTNFWIGPSSSNSRINCDLNDYLEYNRTSNYFEFFTNSTSRMRIGSGINVYAGIQSTQNIATTAVLSAGTYVAAGTALDLTPQTTAPGLAYEGITYIHNPNSGSGTSGRKLVIHDGSGWERYIPQSGQSTGSSARTTTGVFTNSQYLLNSYSFRPQSVLRLRAWGTISGNTGSVTIGLDIGCSGSPFYFPLTGAGSGTWSIDAVCIFDTYGTTGTPGVGSMSAVYHFNNTATTVADLVVNTQQTVMDSSFTQLVRCVISATATVTCLGAVWSLT